MKPLVLVLCLLLIVPTLRAGDTSATQYPGQYLRTTKVAHVTYKVQYSGLTVGHTYVLRKNDAPTENWIVFTPGTTAGTYTAFQQDYYAGNYGYLVTSNPANEHDKPFADHGFHDAYDSSVSGSPSVPGSGGRVLTFDFVQDATPQPDPGQTINSFDIVYTLGSAPHSATFTGSVKANCATQHALGLTINGVQVSYQVTSAFATRDAPSTVTVSYNCSSTTIDCADGKPWVLSVDGDPTNSGNITYAGGTADYNVILNVGGKGSVSDPVFFDCAPPRGTLHLAGSLKVGAHSGAYTLIVKKNGVQVGSSGTSTFNSGADQVMTISADITADGGDTISWYVNGVLQATQTVSITCTTNPETGTQTCSDLKEWSGSAQGAGPTPTPNITPPATPPPTPPPNSTPPPTPPPSTPQPTVATGSSGVTVMNPNDFYLPVLNALNDSGKAADISGFASNGYPNVADGYDGHTQDLAASVNNSATSALNVVNAVQDMVTQANSNFATLPTSIGTVDSVDLGTNDTFGYNGVLHLSEWAGPIHLCRTLLLWLLTVSFAILFVQALTYQGSD